MKKTLFTGLLSAGLLLSTQVQAGTWSIHGNIGTTNFDDDELVLNDDSDTFTSAGLAYNLSDSFSIEAAYNDFGAAGVDGNSLDFSSISLATIGSLPISENWNLTGKLGVERLESESNINLGFLGVNFNVEEKSTKAFAGIGLDYSFNDVLTIRTNLDFHDSADIKVLTAGIKYNF